MLLFLEFLGEFPTHVQVWSILIGSALLSIAGYTLRWWAGIPLLIFCGLVFFVFAFLFSFDLYGDLYEQINRADPYYISSVNAAIVTGVVIQICGLLFAIRRSRSKS